MRLNVTSGDLLALEIATAQDSIDERAGAARARYITTAPGQEATYLSKAASAQAYKDAGYPMPCDAAIYPWIAAEATQTTQTPTATADYILAARDAWTVLGSTIEGLRMGCKGRLGAETTKAGVYRELSTGVAALDAI